MDIYDETIMNWLEKKCADASMPSGLCRMEITETSYAAIEADRNATLEALREAGILLLLDDFGSGYSSFGMLQNYNFDIMKIDMSFVRQIETYTKTRSIIRFIIEMAHTMEIKIIAEGAETPCKAVCTVCARLLYVTVICRHPAVSQTLPPASVCKNNNPEYNHSR